MWPCRVTRKMKAQELRSHGPLIEASWSSPKTKGKSLGGVVLLDTGATGIMIDESIAKQLELPVSGLDQIHGSNGWSKTNKYVANLLVPVTSNEGESIIFDCPVECSSIPDLYSRHMEMFNKPVVGILGRVFLQFCRLNICGESGAIELCIGSSITEARQ